VNVFLKKIRRVSVTSSLSFSMEGCAYLSVYLTKSSDVLKTKALVSSRLKDKKLGLVRDRDETL